MSGENEILDELRAAGSFLADVPRTMPYSIPNGYFEQLSDTIVAGVISAESDNPIPDLPVETPFLLPEDYFEESTPLIVAAASLPAGNNPYTVPNGYFESLPLKMLAAAQRDEMEIEKPKTKIIAFPQWRIARIAAAALVILGIGYGSFKIYYTPDIKASHKLARVDKDSIGLYVIQTIDPLPEAAPVHTASTAVAVRDLSPEEITRYLDETGWEDATTAN